MGPGTNGRTAGVVFLQLLAASLLCGQGARTIPDIEYARAGGQPLLLDLYLPENSKAKLPVIVSIHGGGWHGGDKKASPGQHFTKFGYAVAAVNYRLLPADRFPAQIWDVKAAVRWLRAHAAEYNLDSDRVGAWGASAGGHLAALLATSGDVPELEGDLGNRTYSSRVQAAVDFFGPIDVAGWYRELGAPEAALIGGPVEGNEAKLRATSPATYISPDDPPVLVAHGVRDTLVRMHHSEKFHAALREAGVRTELHIVPGAAHSVKELNLDQQVLEFLDQTLR